MKQHELDALLADEIERRLDLLATEGVDPGEARAALHTLRGSAGLAGYADLALVLAQCSARLRAGDASAASDAAASLRNVLRRLRRGMPPFDTRWPEPPPGLGPASVEPEYRAELLSEIRERVSELKAALEGTQDEETLARAVRTVHSLKGTAAAAGDDVCAWYCHGLESLLKRPDAEPAALLGELPRHLSLLLALGEDPQGALETLRAVGQRRRPSVAPPSTRRTSVPPEEDTGEHTVRVQGASLERVLERLELIRLAQDEVSSAAAAADREARRLRDLRGAIVEALRSLGPPRPWGPPAKALATLDAVARALTHTADDLEQGSELARKGTERLKHAAAEVRREIALLRRTQLSSVLAKIGALVERLAEREGRAVRVLVNASDAPVERDVAERLADPLMQLARNALAHGIEPEAERRARGKDPVGTLMLSGERIGDWLRIVVEDDGRGVDIETVRASAIERGSISAEAARAASDDELLALLFVPGLTTRREADLLAGRGVGLDLALNVVRRLGGTIRLSRRAGGGLRATLELPSERWTTDVLWLRAGEWELALPVSFSGTLSRADPARPPVPLLTCLGEASTRPPPLSLELALRGIPTVSVGVDAVGGVEECTLRPLPALLAQSGPYSGAILRGDGSLHLTLDAALLAVRAWALA